ncbi:unnamed protein product [Parascedosporium putredinis]|uniref:Vacuolar protein-sorting-associated protein 36 n=1 Tax=Parascedosporium putredinis TaxID=1442378 RepID=A0A9P1GV82_9PEZI|nr:unnamed protein product [Parascedosporium putredinis]CAI7987963.1 unnamed protein product [Parascedosporium putredinis]
MFLKTIDLTTALRPSYLPDEVLLFVQDNVGLYEGKYKLPNHQNGQVYLTSHRVCYVDKNEPRKYSVALELKDVERYESYARFLKSSPKVTLVPKPPKRGNAPLNSPGSLGRRVGSPRTQQPEQVPVTAATWVCVICSFSNPVPSNFDPTTATANSPTGPSKTDTLNSIKISFRGGGDKIFYERLKGSMTQRKWLLHGAPAIPKGGRGDEELSPSGSAGIASDARNTTKAAGIAALEQRGLAMRRNNELVIGDAFEDLESLMASAKEIVALAEQFARQVNGIGGSAALEASALVNQLGLVTTKDIVGGGSSSESLYLSELARNLAEFLTDDSRGVLKKAGGVVSLVDLWATFNRARGGVELVSPKDFEKAARLWETLKLPVRLRTFKSGVMVVQGHDRTDESIVAAILTWLQDLHEFPPEKEVPWDWHQFGVGITAQEAAQRFGWSLGVAEEELEMAEEKGALCREEGAEGLKYWKNHINTGDIIPLPNPEAQDTEQIMRVLREQGFL